jgi:hypothetical protein
MKQPQVKEFVALVMDLFSHLKEERLFRTSALDEGSWKSHVSP